jgi:hypothetical protein
MKPNDWIGFATPRNIAGDDFIALVDGAEAHLKDLHSPDETKFCLGRHRPANTFPPVFTGLSNFSRSGSGFTPYTNQASRRILL